MKKAISVIVIIAVIIIGVIVWKTTQSPTVVPDETAAEVEAEAETESAVPTTTGEPIVIEEATEENTTPEAIEDSLEGIDLGDLEAEFESIDEDLDSLGL
jgi:cytoskeletal protein RodZ